MLHPMHIRVHTLTERKCYKFHANEDKRMYMYMYLNMSISFSVCTTIKIYLYVKLDNLHQPISDLCVYFRITIIIILCRNSRSTSSNHNLTCEWLEHQPPPLCTGKTCKQAYIVYTGEFYTNSLPQQLCVLNSLSLTLSFMLSCRCDNIICCIIIILLSNLHLTMQ